MVQKRDVGGKRNRRSAGLLPPAMLESLESRVLMSVNMLGRHGGASSDGANVNETVLTPSNVNASDFGKLFTTSLDAQTFAQPLYVQNVNISAGPSQGVHSVIYQATMHDSLYAIDANTGTVLWKDNFLNIADPTNLTPTAGVTTQPTVNLNASLGPELGILATPTIDARSGRLYLNAETREVRGTDVHWVQRLWSVNIADGSIAGDAVIGDTIWNGVNNQTSYSGYTYVSGPIINGTGNNNPTTPTPQYPDTDGWVSAPGGANGYVVAFNALQQMERTAVTLVNGSVYLGFASHADNGPYYGWILGYDAATLNLTAAFNTTPTYEGIVGDRPAFTAQGGIWMSGSPIANDGTSLYLVTGNGAFNADPGNFDAQGFPRDHDYADSLLKLSVDQNSTPSAQNGNGWGLKVADYFTPSNATELNVLDDDLGSGGPMLLPPSLKDAAGNPMLVMGGKESRVYLLDANNLGKFNYSYPASGNPDPRLYDRVLGEYPNDGINGTGSDFYSTASYYNGQFYIDAIKQAAMSFNLATFASGQSPVGTTTPSVLHRTANAFGNRGSTFTISSNGVSNGVVWALNFNGSSTDSLMAFNASTLGSFIYSSNSNAARDALNGGVTNATGSKFNLPTVANGMVYAPTASVASAGLGTVVGYGLLPGYLASNPGYFGAPTGLTATVVNPGDTHLAWTSHSSLAAEFRIDRSSNGSDWTTLAYVENSAAAFDDATANGGNYYYRVVAISGATQTAASVASPNPNTASITGVVFNDVDGDGAQNNGEAALPGATVYLDLANVGHYQNGDPTRVTDASGNYAFTGLAAGAYTVGVILPVGETQTLPAAGANLPVNLASGQALAGEMFGVTGVPVAPAGAIAGVVFVDSNGNTLQDAGEVGVPNCTVYVDLANLGSFQNGDPSAVSDAQGNYSISGLSSGNYVVRLLPQTGYAQSYPADLAALSVALPSDSGAAGQDFGLRVVPPTASISGAVFNDLNGDGHQEIGEQGVSGVSVYIDANNVGAYVNGDPVASTDSLGDYTFNALPAGNYVVRETTPAGFNQTAPLNDAGISVTLADGQSATGNSFGILSTTPAPSASISGTVFNDVDSDGFQNHGEAGLPNATVYIDLDNSGGYTANDLTAVTDSQGNYTFTSLPAGACTVYVLLPGGYAQTAPANGAGISVTLSDGQASTGDDFGIVNTAPPPLTASVSGSVFNDADQSGTQNNAEAGVAGATVYVDLNDVGTFVNGDPSAVTDSQGHYTISGIPAGTYTVREVIPPGQTQTTPFGGTGLSYVMAAGQDINGANFGLYIPPAGSISGTVFNDANHNGVRDPGEAGIANVRVYQDPNYNHRWNSATEQSVLTNAAGNFVFTAPPGDPEILRVILPGGAQQTLPANGIGIWVGKNTGATLTGENFGLYTPVVSASASITGIVYNDANGDHLQNSGEAGKGGVTVFIDADGNGQLSASDPTAITDPYGNFSFTGLPAGVYTLYVVPGPGFRQTYPIAGGTKISLAAGKTQSVGKFGVTSSAYVGGILFNDLNGNGAHDAGEAILTNWKVYIDLNNDGKYESNEPTSTTTSVGYWYFRSVLPTTYTIRAIAPAGWSTNHPYTVTLSSGQTITNGAIGVRKG